jgi:hypothetical protein
MWACLSNCCDDLRVPISTLFGEYLRRGIYVRYYPSKIPAFSFCRYFAVGMPDDVGLTVDLSFTAAHPCGMCRRHARLAIAVI